MEANVFIQLGVSILLGLLVGLEREHTKSSVAGIRTFPLITAFGTVCGWLGMHYGGWIIAAGLVALAGMLFVANLTRVKAGDIDPGLTTEIAVLVLFGIGACIVIGPMAVAVTPGRHRGGVVATQKAVAPLCGRHRRSRYEGHHAIRADNAGDSAGAAG